MSGVSKNSDPKRSLREQTEYLQEVQQKRRGSRGDKPEGIRHDDMSRILTSSIQKAKEKLQNIDSSIQQKAAQLTDHSQLQDYMSVNTVDSKEFKNVSQVSQMTEVRRPPIDSTSTAIASAMKCLQAKNAELEGKLEVSHKEKEKLVIDAKRAQQCQEIAERSLEGQKMINQELTDEKVRLEREVELLRKAIDDREKKLQKLKKDLAKQTEMSKTENVQLLRDAQSLRTENSEKDRMLQTFAKELQLSETKLRSKQKQIDQRVSQLVEIQKQLSKRQKQLAKSLQDRTQSQHSQVSRLQDSISHFQQQIADLQSVNDMNKILIGKLESELDIQRQKGSQWMSRQIEQAYIEKINMLEQQLTRLRANNKTQQKLQTLKQQHEKLRDMYDNLLLRYERAENGKQAEEKEAKKYRQKFWEVKEILKEFTDKLQKLPSGITSQMKYLIVKASKVEYERSSIRHERTISHSGEKLSKSSRGRSDSREKSLKKRKILKMQDLNSSRNSARSISVNRSHNKSTNKSDIKSTHSKRSRKSSSKQQQPLLTNLRLKTSLKETIDPKLLFITDRQIVLSSEINDLQKKMLALKRQLKKLIDGREPENESQAEDRRARKNELIAEIQVKSEELFVLKKKAKEESA